MTEPGPPAPSSEKGSLHPILDQRIAPTLLLATLMQLGAGEWLLAQDKRERSLGGGWVIPAEFWG